MLERVAVIGLGNMGLPIARNLLRAWFPLTVHNRTKAKAEPLVAEGAAWAESPAAAGARARIVVTMVSDDSALDGVVSGEHGLLGALERDAIHVAMSTVEPATARRLADAHHRHGARYVAAPVFGRPETAEQARRRVSGAGRGGRAEGSAPPASSWRSDSKTRAWCCARPTSSAFRCRSPASPTTICSPVWRAARGTSIGQRWRRCCATPRASGLGEAAGDERAVDAQREVTPCPECTTEIPR